MDDSTPAKTCTGCGLLKPHDDFGVDRQKRDGLTTRCRPCRRLESVAYMATPRAKELARKRAREWIKRNPEKQAAAMAAWRAQHPWYSAEANRKWREANPEADAAYHQANREKSMERTLRRRRRISEASMGPVDLAALWDDCEGVCALCGELIDFDLAHPDRLSKSVDHIVPLSKGGTHEQSNLQWTHLVCNIRKGATVPC